MYDKYTVKLVYNHFLSPDRIRICLVSYYANEFVWTRTESWFDNFGGDEVLALNIV